MILNTVLRAAAILTRMPVEKKHSQFSSFAPRLPSRLPVNNPQANDSKPEQPDENASADASAAAPMTGLPKIIKFDSLARCGDEIWIENEGQIYRLRKTRQGKLILTK
jgi:hemin uptake protein HemP